MTVKLPTRFERRLVRAAHFVCAGIVGTALNIPIAVADAQSDLFQPDVFRMGKALQKRTDGLSDPRGRDCPLPAQSLSLSAAVDLALCRNPTTREAWATARQQAAALGGAESAWLPTLSAPLSVARTFGEHVDVAGESLSADQTTKDAALNLTWVLYDFGGRGAHIDSARLLLDSQALTVNRVSQQTILNVVQSFYGVVAGDAAVVAAKSAEDAYKKSVEISSALQKGGLVSLADVLLAETAYDQAVLARIQAEYTAVAAHGAMSVAIGWPADQPLKLDAQPVPAEVPNLSARMADLMAEAKRQRPDLGAALAQRDAAVANVTIARAVGRPSISIQGGRSYSYVTGVPSQDYNQIGIYVTVPVFSGFSVDYGVRQAQAALENSEANVDQVRLTVASDVWNGYYSLDSANQQLGATAILVKTANQNQDVELGRYQAGVGTILDLLTAQASAASAAQSRITAEEAWEVARGQLALALGHLSRAEPLVTEPALP
jgi:outer membrane protein TolC